MKTRKHLLAAVVFALASFAWVQTATAAPGTGPCLSPSQAGCGGSGGGGTLPIIGGGWTGGGR